MSVFVPFKRRGGPNPYQRFLIGLGLSVSLAAIGVAVTVNILIGRFLVSSTAAVTEDAVARHFRLILPDIFHAQMTPQMQSTPQGTPQGATPSTDPYAMAGMAMTGDALNLTVRLHFDLYHITDATFYQPDGRISFAYRRDQIGHRVSGAALARLRRLETAGLETSASDERVRVRFAIRKSEGGQPGAIEGFVSIERDLHAEWAAVRGIEASVLAVSTAAALVLFFVLRGVYRRSSRDLADSNRDLRALAVELEQSYDASLHALSSALDLRDNETAGHAERVTRYALRLAQEMGLPEAAMLGLARGAILHDVGKIGIPDAILRKPGNLDAGEQEIMRSHVTLGDAMLEGVSFLDEARGVLRHHHERWDGHGYPDGLAREAIPLSARIFAVCDTYDAITSDRPYTRARPDGLARAEIEAQSGLQFDPAVVAAFLRISSTDWLEAGRRPRITSQPNPRALETVTGAS